MMIASSDKKASKVPDVMNRLMEGILAGQYGTKLPPQNVLATSFGVGRSSVREAISKLESFNIVRAYPKAGTKINPPEEWNGINGEVIAWWAKAGVSDKQLHETIEEQFRLANEGAK
jgi:DNA-binding FadR family transcriptional regulator